MKKITIFFVFLFLLPQLVLAWNRITHDSLCQENIDCNVADSFEFQKANPYANILYHVCYDNTEDCMPRLTAKYFLKKYYIEGEKDKNLLGAAAHLFQDSYCPLHWYPGFLIFGEEVYLFAPKEIKTIEEEVGHRISAKEKSWNIPIKRKGETINIDKAYMDNIKEENAKFLLREPEESLVDIESKIKSKKIWHRLRGYQDFTIILFIFFIPILAYGIWEYKKKKVLSSNLIISAVALFILICLFILTKSFY